MNLNYSDSGLFGMYIVSQPGDTEKVSILLKTGAHEGHIFHFSCLERQRMSLLKSLRGPFLTVTSPGQSKRSLVGPLKISDKNMCDSQLQEPTEN